MFFAESELFLGGVGADACAALFSPERHVKAHQAIIDALWQTEQTSHDVVPHGKSDTSVALLCLWPAAPEEGVVCAHLL
ncbi:unnamed protein product [Schistocephalus solidus]|uniref:PPM-type phosphatase domain-containing protein n=1 Tax=Schistocephalus solidus TaxID=70667 RepID=A0A183T780_SCHSO|nr:unnamed protein product [Schistocephalus solidus]